MRRRCFPVDRVRDARRLLMARVRRRAGECEVQVPRLRGSLRSRSARNEGKIGSLRSRSARNEGKIGSLRSRSARNEGKIGSLRSHFARNDELAVALSYCPTVQLSYCPTVPPPR